MYRVEVEVSGRKYTKNVPDGFVLVPPGEVLKPGDKIAYLTSTSPNPFEESAYLSPQYDAVKNWAFGSKTYVPGKYDEYRVIRQAGPVMVDCHCTKHKVSAAALAADKYAAHNAWVLDEGRESFATTIGDVGIRKSKPVYVAQVDEQFGDEF